MLCSIFIEHNNKVQERLGSEGVLPLDDRYNLYNKVQTVKKYLNKLKTDYICKFEIRRCNSMSPFENYTVIHSENFLKETAKCR